MKTPQELQDHIVFLEEQLSESPSFMDVERITLFREVLGSGPEDMMNEAGVLDYMDGVKRGIYVIEEELPADMIWDSALAVLEAVTNEVTDWVLGK